MKTKLPHRPDNTLKEGCEKRLVRESSNTVMRHLDRIIHQLDEAAGTREYSADAIWLEEVRDRIRRLESELNRYKDREKHCELTEAWHLLNVLCLNMMDDGPTWPRVLEWLRRNEKFRPANA